MTEGSAPSIRRRPRALGGAQEFKVSHDPVQPRHAYIGHALTQAPRAFGGQSGLLRDRQVRRARADDRHAATAGGPAAIIVMARANS
jgi:hypothetical protein